MPLMKRPVKQSLPALRMTTLTLVIPLSFGSCVYWYWYFILVYRPSLERRLTRLEKKLKLPEHERHVCEATLQTANEVRIFGVRLHHTSETLKLDKSLKPIINPQLKPVSDGPKMFDLSMLKPPDSAINAKPEVSTTARFSFVIIDNCSYCNSLAATSQFG